MAAILTTLLEDTLKGDSTIVPEYGTEIIDSPIHFVPLSNIPSLFAPSKEEEEETCGKCRLLGNEQGFYAKVAPYNQLATLVSPADLVLLWEAPEDAGSQASKLLFNILYQMVGDEFPSTLVVHAVRCHNEKTNTAKLLETCAGHYLKRLLLSPNYVTSEAVIVAIGSNAWKALHFIAKDSPAPGNISDIHGLPSQLSFVGEEERVFNVVPVLHPSFVIRNSRRMDDILMDFQRVVDVMQGGWDSKSAIEEQEKIKEQAVRLSSMPSMGELTNIAEGLIAESDGILVLDVEGRDIKLPSCGNYLTLTGFGASDEIAFQLSDDAITATTFLLHKIRDAGGMLVGQNIYYDFMMLYKQRLISSPDDLPEYRDTMIMHQLIDENAPAGLKTMVQQYFGVPDWSKALPKGTDFGKIPMDQLAPYHACDLCYNHKLYTHLADIVDLEEVSGTWQIDYIQFMHKVDRLLLGASISGMKIDTEYLATLEQQYVEKMEDIEEWFAQSLFHRIVASLRELDTEVKKTITQTFCTFPLTEEYDEEKHSFNPGSTQQLGAYLATVLDAPTKQRLFQALGKSLRTPSGAISLNEANINSIKVHLSKTEKMQRDFADIIQALTKILEYREASKILGTYIVGMAQQIWPDGCVRAHWKVRGTVTGRLACSNPNLQNIPRSQTIKRMFVPKRHGWVFMQFDLSQAEMRGLASFTGDEALAAGYRQGLDMHKYVASKAFNVNYDDVTHDERQAAKTIGFASIYGSSAYGLAAKNNLSVDKCEELLSNFFKEFPRVQPWIDEQHYKVRTQEYVTGALGRKRHLPANMAIEEAGTDLLREGQNAPIQNLASDFNLLLLVLLMETKLEEFECKEYVDFVNTVHDSLIFEVHPAYCETLFAAYENAMQEVNQFYAAVMGEDRWVDMAGEAEIGISWGDLNEYALGDEIPTSASEEE